MFLLVENYKDVVNIFSVVTQLEDEISVIEEPLKGHRFRNQIQNQSIKAEESRRQQLQYKNVQLNLPPPKKKLRRKKNRRILYP